MQVAEGLSVRNIYFLMGTTKHVDTRGRAIEDPPMSGWSRCFVIEGEKRSIVFHPQSMQAYEVPNSCTELEKSREVTHIDRDFYCGPDGLIRRQAVMYREYGLEVAFRVADKVLKMLGADGLDLSNVQRGVKQPPRELTDEERLVFHEVVPPPAGENRFGDKALGSFGDLDREKVKASLSKDHKGTVKLTDKVRKGGGGGKPAADKVIKPLKPGKRMEAYKFFAAPEGASVTRAMEHFKTTRSNVLSMLFLLNKEHGLGYRLSGDTATLEVPEGRLLP